MTDTPKAGDGTDDRLDPMEVMPNGFTRLANAVQERARNRRENAPSPAPLATGGEVDEAIKREALRLWPLVDHEDHMEARHTWSQGARWALATSPTRVGDGELLRRLDAWLKDVAPGYYRGSSYEREIAAALRAFDAGGGWRTIESAPKDGTVIIAWCVHPNARWAGDSKEWACPVVTQWIDHNGGGWTWHGMAGTFTHWMPAPVGPNAPAPPAAGGRGDEGVK